MWGETTKIYTLWKILEHEINLHDNIVYSDSTDRDNPRQSTFSWDDHSCGMTVKPKIGQSILHSFLGQSGKDTFLHWYNELFTSFELLETIRLEVTFTSGHIITCAKKFSSLFLSQLVWIWLLSLEWRGLSNIAFWPTQHSSKHLKH